MTKYTKRQLAPLTFKGEPLEASFFYCPEVDYLGTLLYFHGGGLIFGQRDDLPEVYLEMLTQAGYGLLSLDYPLAPESQLADILQVVKDWGNWWLSKGPTSLDLPEKLPCYPMGRSAGGYLATYLMTKREGFAGLISLYGYYNLNDASFKVPAREFLKYPKVNPQIIDQLVGEEPIFQGPMEQRYPIYLASRQDGSWMDQVIGSDHTASDFSISKDALGRIPQAFIAAAKQDPDVPSRQSRQMAANILNSELEIIDSQEHDFDRTQVEELGIPLYQQLIEWLRTSN
ncbi:alpha/beta hydrolase [Hutsoniella sourekii]